MGTSANVISGPGVIYVAPNDGSVADPDLTVSPVVWPVGWKQFGYTDDGVDFQYGPSWKDFDVDEEMAPVDTKLIKEKLSVIMKLAEATLNNLGYAIAGSSLVQVDPTSSTIGTLTLAGGSAASTSEFKLGFQGPAPGTNLTRVVIIYRAKSKGTVTVKYQRKDKVIIGVSFEALADGTKAAGARLFKMVDQLAEVTVAPTITSFNPVTTPAASPVPVLITGTGFGSAQGALGEVKVAAVAATILFWSNTQIIIEVGSTTTVGATEGVIVTAASGLVSTGTHNIAVT